MVPEVAMSSSSSASAVVFPVNSWGEFGLLLTTRLRRRTFLLRCATCQSHGTRLEIRLVLPNQEELQLHGRVVDSSRQEEAGQVLWLTRLTLEQLPDVELARWEQLAAARPRSVTLSPLVSQPRMSSAPPARASRNTSLDPGLFDDVPGAEEPAALLSLEERLEHEMAVARAATERGDHPAAIAAIERALTLCPGAPVLEARLHIARARQAADLGQITLVESLVSHALSLSPSCLKPGDPLLGILRPGPKKRNLFAFLRRS
jgi:hypothetical protein